MKSSKSKSSSTFHYHLDTSKLHPVIRIALAVLSILSTLFCAVNAIIIGLATIALAPAFLNYSTVNPLGALLGTTIYIGNTFIFCGLTILSATFAHHLFKKQTISTKALLIYIALIALAILIFYGLLPLFANTLGLA